MSHDELSGLIEDIKTNGLREPIILLDGAILDGRNRYCACTQLGLEPITRAWDGKGDPIEYVLSKNLHRRHLNESQRATVASKVATLKQGGTGANQHSPAEAPIGASAPTLDEAAKRLNVGRRSIQRARVVLDKGIPELQTAVETGQVSVSAAAEIATKPQEEQRKIMQGGKQTIGKATKAIRANKTKKRKPNGAVAMAQDYQPETEHERDLRILRSCWECTGPSARHEFLEDVADEIQEYQLLGTPDEICEAILHSLGVDQAKKVVRALDKRLRNVKPDCLACGGTGFAPAQFSTACGMPIGSGKIPCDCSPAMQGLAKKTVCADSIEEVPPNHVDEHRAA
jgi:ParB-like chromosome segregation protein Spo0J